MVNKKYSMSDLAESVDWGFISRKEARTLLLKKEPNILKTASITDLKYLASHGVITKKDLRSSLGLR